MVKNRIKYLIKGLEILSEYSPHVVAVNNYVYAGPEKMKEVSMEDRKTLDELGWLFEEKKGWSIFV